MLKDTIDRVQLAEKQAQELVYKAQEEADVIIERAKAEAEKLERDSAGEAALKSEKAVEEADAVSKEAIAGAKLEVEKEIEELRNKAAGKTDAAVAAVVEAVLGKQEET